MAEIDEPVIPAKYRPRPKRLDFYPKRFAFDGYVAMEAKYTNGVGQKFLVTIAAQTAQRRSLRAYAAELRVWLRAEPLAVATEKTSGEDTHQRLRRLLQRLVRQGVKGSRLAFAADAYDLPGIDPAAPVVVYWRIDPTVARGAAKAYSGPDVVIASVVRNTNYPNSQIKLSGLTATPHTITIGAARTRDANRYCTVAGVYKSKFTLDAKEGQGTWVRVN